MVPMMVPPASQTLKLFISQQHLRLAPHSEQSPTSFISHMGTPALPPNASLATSVRYHLRRLSMWSADARLGLFL